jgi:hypothetical protein
MDRLPGMKRGLAAGEKEKVQPIKKMVGPHSPSQYKTGHYRLNHVVAASLLWLLIGIITTLYSPLLLESFKSRYDISWELPPGWKATWEDLLSRI